MKKSLITTFALAITILATTANASTKGQTYSDVTKAHPNFEAIEELSGRLIINGNPDGTFRPNNPINRAELTKMVTEMMEVVKPGLYNEECFNDIEMDQWYTEPVCRAKSQGWINGYGDGTFRPGDNATRAEAIKIILTVFYSRSNGVPGLSPNQKLYTLMPSDAEEGAWYYGLLQFALQRNLLDRRHEGKVDGALFNYFATGNMTRKEVAEMIYRLIKGQDERIISAVINYAQEVLKIHEEDLIFESITQSQMDKDYANVVIQRTDTITDPASIYLKMSANSWDVTIGAHTSIEEQELEEAGIPEDIR